MRKIILLLFILIIYIASSAQQRGIATIQGVVYETDSITVIEGAVVRAISSDTVYRDTTDADGNYAFVDIFVHDLMPTFYSVIVNASGFFSDTITIMVTNGDEITQDFYLGQAGSIEGTVVLNGISGFGTVEDVSLNLILDNDTIQSTSPDAVLGYYSFGDLQPGDYEISASLNNFITKNEFTVIDNVEVDTVNFSLDLIPGSIFGHVTLEDGAVTDVSITLNDTIQLTSPDADGFYEFTDVEPDIYTVKASLTGYVADTIYNEQSVVPGSAIIDLDFIMQLGVANIIGQVVNTDNEPIENATVTALGVEGVLTDSDGYYEIPDVSPGFINITVTANEYITLYIDTLLVSGSNTINFQLQYQPMINLNIQNDSILNFFAIVDNISESKSFSIMVQHLNEPLNVSLNNPFEISLNDSENFTNEIEIDTLSIFDTIEIFVRFKPSETIVYSDSITITSFGAETKMIKIEGSGLEHMHATIISDAEIVCSGDNIILVSNVTGGLVGTYSFEWSNGSDEPSTIVTPITETDYTLIVTDSVGNTSFAQKTIHVFNEVIILEDPTSITICAATDTAFRVVLEEDEFVYYNWLVNDIAIEDDLVYSGSNTSELKIYGTNIAMNNNIYKCKFTRCNNESYSEGAQLEIFRLPIDTIVVKGVPSPIVLISPDSGLIYQWYEDDIILAGETGQFYYPPGGLQSGSEYYVEIENEFGCKVTTLPYEVSFQKDGIVIYPNPVSNSIYIDIVNSTSEQELKIVFTDMAGRQIINESIDSKIQKTNLSLRNLIKGIYLVRIVDQANKLLYSNKIIKN